MYVGHIYEPDCSVVSCLLIFNLGMERVYPVTSMCSLGMKPLTMLDLMEFVHQFGCSNYHVSVDQTPLKSLFELVQALFLLVIQLIRGF